MAAGWRRHARKLAWPLGLVAGLAIGHAVLVRATRIDPPPVAVPPEGGGHAWQRVRAGLREVYLDGSPERIGADDARLTRAGMIDEERVMWNDFERYVPWWIARVGLQDWSRVRYRHVDTSVPDARRRELAAQSLAFAPDPFDARMPTYQRMLFLHALYDITLALEHSPLIGCTSFAFEGHDGHEIVGRAFDFEAGDVFDSGKVVYLVREDGAIPFASVAWPGFVGVVTGMNAEGVVMVVHGGRAREPSADGVPVAFSLREALSHARDAAEAVAILREQRVMVSHIVFVADGGGHASIVERAPGEPAYVRSARGRLWTTNTFEGPLSSDPRNVLVRETTTSRDRAERVEQLLGAEPGPQSVSDALAILRDHACAREPRCALGDRRAIDALIATHGIVADATARALWVGVGPHLSGPFVKVDVAAELAAGHDPAGDPPADELPADSVLGDGRYGAAIAARRLPE